MKKELALDKFIRNLIDKYLFEIAVGLLILMSVFIRFKLAPNTELSPDYDSSGVSTAVATKVIRELLMAM